MNSSLPPQAPSPEPVQELVLSASVYCDGLLDALLQHAITPFWRQLRQERRYSLWMLRYSRRGSHLKLRVHGPPGTADLDSLRQKLREHVEPFLASLGPPDPLRPRQSSPDTSPLDPEDEGEDLYPDRTLRWTSYRLLPGHLGREPLSAAPGFAAGYVRSLSEAASVVLDNLTLDPDGRVRPGPRLTLLMRMVLAALEGLGLSPEEELEYLLFHRDWLLLGSKGDWQSAVSFLDQKVQGARQQLERLEAATALRHQGSHEPPALGPFTAWQQALRQHLSHALATLGASAPRKLDREQRHQLLAAIARVVHNTANLLEVDLSNEIHLCHLLGWSLRPLLGSNPPAGSFLVSPPPARQP